MGTPARTLLDIGLAVVATAAVQLDVWLASGEGQTFSRPEVSSPILLLATLPLAVRRQAPVLVAGVYALAVVAEVVTTREFVSSPGLFFTGLFVFFAVGRWASSRAAVIGVGLAALGIAVREAFSFPRSEFDNWNAGVFYVLLLLSAALGVLLRIRTEARESREDASRAAAEHDARIAAVEAERAQMAREMHDLVAHSVSAAIVQAEAAEAVLYTSPARSQQSLKLIQQTGREALAEMRRVLGHLRDPGASDAAPQPSFADIEGLVRAANVGDFTATYELTGQPHGLNPGQELCAYRVVQESLSNARRHAGPAAHTNVRATFGPDSVELEVIDSGSGPAEDWTEGSGLSGMRERVALCGGHVDARPADEGGFEVRVCLPYEAVQA